MSRTTDQETTNVTAELVSLAHQMQRAAYDLARMADRLLLTMEGGDDDRTDAG